MRKKSDHPAFSGLESEVYSDSKTHIDFLEISDEMRGHILQGIPRGPHGSTRITNNVDLLQYLRHTKAETRVALICQTYSWAPLEVSKDMFETLVSSEKAMEEIWDLALSFRRQVSEVEQAFSMCAWHSTAAIYETAYVFKYPVRKVCEGLDFWFIRQGGVYQKYASDSKKNNWLLIFPNADSLSSEAVVDIMTADKHPLAPHLALHFSHLVQWRWYMADFHAKIETAANTLMNVEIEARLDFVEMYRQVSGLRFVETNLKPLVPIFAAHNRVLAKLRSWNHDFQCMQQISGPMAQDFSSRLDNHEAKLEALEQNVQFLLSRTASVIQMVSTELQTPDQIFCSLTKCRQPWKASDTISLKSQNTTEDMSNHMLSDSAAIRVITVMTLFYLPSSFVSGFFGMGFFATADATLAGWTVSPYLWIYLIVALPLTALTVCYWWWKSRPDKRRATTSVV